MEAIDEIDFDEAKLEDSAPLEAIRSAILTRCSATKSSVLSELSKPISLNATNVAMLQALRSGIESLAPKFINMDYPYWDYDWREFPVMYSADTMRKDAEHSMSVLPAISSSFDDDSIAVYRTFLKNCVYWLKKFRYVRVQSKYNKRLKREWSWRQTYAFFTLEDEYSASENGTTLDNVTSSTLSALKNSQAGVITNDNPSGLRDYHDISCEYFLDNFKRMTYPTRPDGPLQEVHEIWWTYRFQNVPQKLWTYNGTAYSADLYWYVRPKPTSSAWNYQRNYYWVTQYDNGTVYRWGDNNQFSGTWYSPQKAKASTEEFQGIRWSNKSTDYSSSESTGTELIQRLIKTNWTRDGSRSCVVTDETTTTPYTGLVADANSGSSTIVEFNDLGLGINVVGTSAPPRIKSATMQPHSSYTLDICNGTNLPAPNFAPPGVDYGPGDSNPPLWTYRYESLYRVYASSTIMAVLDFGDYSIPDPEEE